MTLQYSLNLLVKTTNLKNSLAIMVMNIWSPDDLLYSVQISRSDIHFLF